MTDPDREHPPQGDGEKPSQPPGSQAPDPKPLTPEEQMALYEKDLKESDWGHQPC